MAAVLAIALAAPAPAASPLLTSVITPGVYSSVVAPSVYSTGVISSLGYAAPVAYI